MSMDRGPGQFRKKAVREAGLWGYVEHLGVRNGGFSAGRSWADG